VDFQNRRILLSDELPLPLAAELPRQHADIDPGKQRPEATDTACDQAGLDHPEFRILCQQRFGLSRRRNGHEDTRLVRRKRKTLYRSEHDILVLELRLTGLQPFAAFEGDRDRWPLLRQRVPCKPHADRDSDDRDHPNDRHAPRASRGRAREGRWYRCITHGWYSLGLA